MRARIDIVLCLVTLAALSGCGRAKLAEVDQKLPPQVTLYGVRLHSWEGSELVTKGRAAKLTYDRASSNFDAYEALVQFPSRQNSNDAQIRAPRAQGNLGARTADGSGGVTVRSGNGLSGKTEAAHFDGVGLVASGKTPVQVRGPGYSLDADGFTFYFATEELLFDGNVQSRLGQTGPLR